MLNILVYSEVPQRGYQINPNANQYEDGAQSATPQRAACVLWTVRKSIDVVNVSVGRLQC